MGTVQALTNIQNKILQESKWLYQKVNNSTLKSHFLGKSNKIQGSRHLSDRDYVLSLQEDLTELLLSVTYTDLSFNKDSTIIYDFDHLYLILSGKILKNRRLL